MAFEKFISNEDLNQLPIDHFKGDVEVIETEADADRAVQELLKEAYIGFDSESKPTFVKGKTNQNPMALMQFSTSDKAYLFRLNKIGIPDSVCDLLESETTRKIGVALHSDMDKFRKLKKSRLVKPKGFVDLQTVAKKNEVKNLGLKKLSGIFLGFRISKRHQLSNWESKTLSEGQIRYAATDAWVCYELYKAFLKEGWIKQY